MSEHHTIEADANGFMFRNWNRALSELLVSDDQDDQLKCLISALDHLVPFDDWLVAVFHRGHIPTVLGYSVPDGRPDAYGEGAYLLDPFYEGFLSDLGPGCFKLGEICPDGLMAGDFYDSYYQRFDFVDEVGYLLPLDQQSTLHVSLGRAGRRNVFSPDEVRLLTDAMPVVEAIGGRLWSSWHEQGDAPMGHDSAMLARFEHALDQFTPSSLTAREREVMRLQLRGHSVKAIARLLNISPGTVRNHSKRIHLKLEISSQRELFSMFIERSFVLDC